ncbi:DUF6175 family protein [Flavobacteriales bacterium]|nr:DUF6175 family protein [Flavobacteriales bacterium]
MKNLLLVLFTIFYTALSAQNIQPSMMVLPYTKSGESALGLYEEQKEYRAIIAGIEQAIIDRGGELRDLERTIQNAREQMLREGNKYKGVQDAINQNASAEITVEAEIDYHNTGKYIQFGIRLKAVETSTGTVVYPGKYFSSPNFPYNTNFQTVATNLLTYDKGDGVYIDIFMNGMQAGFTKMVKEGKPITAIVLTDDNSAFFLNDEANDDFELITDKIDEWVSSKAHNGIFNVESSSDNRLEMTIKIPLRDADDKPYSTKKFAKEFRIAILKICRNVSNTMGDGSRVDGGSTQENIDKGTIMVTMPAFK